MRGWGFKVQIGGTYLAMQAWPFDWEIYTSLNSPRHYGVGLWITRNRYA